MQDRNSCQVLNGLQLPVLRIHRRSLLDVAGKTAVYLDIHHVFSAHSSGLLPRDVPDGESFEKRHRGTLLGNVDTECDPCSGRCVGSEKSGPALIPFRLSVREVNINQRNESSSVLLIPYRTHC